MKDATNRPRPTRGDVSFTKAETAAVLPIAAVKHMQENSVLAMEASGNAPWMAACFEYERWVAVPNMASSANHDCVKLQTATNQHKPTDIAFATEVVGGAKSLDATHMLVETGCVAATAI